MREVRHSKNPDISRHLKKKNKKNKYEKVSCPTIVSKEPISSAQLRFVRVMSMLQEVYLLSFKVKMKVSVT